MKKLLVVLPLLVAFASRSLFSANFSAGDNELGLSAELTSGDDLKTTNFSIDWGYHFAAEHQGSVLLAYDKTEAGLFDVTGGFFGLGYDYNILEFKKDIVPYLGGGFRIPLSDYKDIYDSVLYIHGGMKFFLSPKTALRVSLDIEKYSGADNYDDSTSLALRAGYIVKFCFPESSGKKTGATKKKKSPRRKKR